MEAKFALLQRVSALPKKAKRKVQKRTRVARSSHPLSVQVKGLLNPAAALPGTAHHLVDVAPSQKYSLKSRFTVSIGSGNSCVGVVSPCFIENNNFPSAIFVNGTSGQLNTGFIQNSQVGTSITPSGVTGLAVKPTRPYSASADKAWRLVSYQLRVRYAGSALNANGNFKVLNNNHGELGFVENNATTTWWNIFEAVDKNIHTSLRTVYDRAVHDYPGVGSTTWYESDEYFCSDLNTDGNFESKGERIGQDSSPYIFGEPGIIITYTNSSTGAINLECELYENWEVKGPSVGPFMTPSHPDPVLHEEVMRTFLSSHVHSSKDSGVGGSMSKFLKLANTESKSPLGKAVIAAALA